VENDIVAFWFKNTRKDSIWETTTLPVIEFMKRFPDHVLPRHFHRIRYYGFLANGKARSNIDNIRHALAATANQEPQANQDEGVACPKCDLEQACVGIFCGRVTAAQLVLLTF